MSDLTFSEGQSKLGVGEKTIVPTERERAVFKALMNDPLFNVSDTKFPSWMVDTVGRLGLAIPIGQIVGYAQTVPQVAAAILTAETTASDAFTDLATVGPSLGSLPDGKYFIMYSAIASNDTGGDGGAISVQINSTAASSDDQSLAQTGTLSTTLVGWAQKDLDAGVSNSVTVKYSRVTGGTALFSTRRLVAIRVGNL